MITNEPAAAHQHPHANPFPISEPESTVVFVSDDPRVRQAKIAFALRNAGWKVILLHQKEPDFVPSKYFDAAIPYRSVSEAVSLAHRIPAAVFHIFSIWGDLTSVRMMQARPGKMVYDYWDLVEGIKAGQKLIPMQRYCMENADGLCCRDLRGRYAVEVLGYQPPRQMITFPDYCWNNPTGETIPVFAAGEPHLVACGCIGIEKNGEIDHGYLDIARRFASNGIHLHIYPHPTQLPFEELFSDYLTLAADTPYFHLHRAISMGDVIRELACYDAGVTITRALTFDAALSGYAPWYLNHCGSARLFDYIDAGLPVILNKQLRFQYALLEPHGLALNATPEMLANPAEHLDRLLSPDNRQKAIQVRALYDVKAHIGELIQFYRSL